MNYNEQIAALQAQIKELEAKRDGITPWMPEKGGEYFAVTINNGHEVAVAECIYRDHGLFKNRAKNLGTFKTKVEAENRIKQIRAITKWQSIPNDFVPDWGDYKQWKYYPIIRHDEIDLDYSCGLQFFPFQHFATKEQCQRAIDWMGEESMRHLFGIFGD
jgi:hypothetical protein